MASTVESSTSRRAVAIASIAVLCIAGHLILRFVVSAGPAFAGFEAYELPLLFALTAGGAPLVFELASKAVRREFGADLLAGVSIVTAVLLGEYLAGSLVVLMLSGGQTLEYYAVRSASSVLLALAKRMPTLAHRKRGDSIEDVPIDQIAVGEMVVVFPHELGPVDGVVVEGRGTMDESYLTGEPYLIGKAPGSSVLSGAVNGETALTVRCEKPASDSRYAKIMQVMRASEQQRPRIRRLGDQLGALYTPVALTVAIAAWLASGEPIRFLAVLVVATPCPLLIAIPVAVIGAVSLSARRGIVIRDPAILEKIDACRTAIFDKTGTLTYGKPALTKIHALDGFDADEILAHVAGLERYSKHPLAAPILEAAAERRLPLPEVTEVHEPPGQGMRGRAGGRVVQATSRKQLAATHPEAASDLPQHAAGLECVVLLDERPAAVLEFRDEPRREGAPFVRHLGPKHDFDRVMIVSGDREEEVRRLADRVGVRDVRHGQSPEQKLAIVREETGKADTVFVGDGINDAPALAAATVGVAVGQNSEVTSEAAGAVILDSSLQKIDELLHISRRMRRIALQSAVGGMALSVVGMLVAAAGYLPPVAGAVFQEIIDVAAVLNALRAAWPPKKLTDY